MGTQPKPPCPEAQLVKLYSELRARYFTTPQGVAVLPAAEHVRIEWSSRMTASAGLCYPARRLIRLSTHYHARHPDEIEATLLHEMIHLVVPGHGPEFYRWMERIRALGGRVERYCRERPLPKRGVRWTYTCRSCGRIYPYTRRLAHGGRRHYCRRCGPVDGRLWEKRV